MPPITKPMRKSRDGAPRHGLARALSKLGVASRTESTRLILAGRISVDGRVVTDPEHGVQVGQSVLSLDGVRVGAAAPVYLMLNKPRGLVTTASDPQGRPTVYSCLEGLDLPHVSPVGRLDKASEGLLLLTNDTLWANAVLEGDAAPLKTYHVQIDTRPDADLPARLVSGVMVDEERLRARTARILREGTRNAWLEIVLDEGRNRQIRRLLSAFDIAVLRLVRVSIGALVLGDLGKGAARELTSDEVVALAPTGLIGTL